jgi:hypothetical protein
MMDAFVYRHSNRECCGEGPGEDSSESTELPAEPRSLLLVLG